MYIYSIGIQMYTGLSENWVPPNPVVFSAPPGEAFRVVPWTRYFDHLAALRWLRCAGEIHGGNPMVRYKKGDHMGWMDIGYKIRKFGRMGKP